jgi:O-acetyl-ADP-ribose deacetylase (regulator of RNase III)
LQKEIKTMEERIIPNYITTLADNEIFVFGSNLAGTHGGGVARRAYDKFGAIWGKGVGLQGKSYAIPTMQGGTETIRPYVDEFIRFAQSHPNMKFLVTAIGCGIAGFNPKDIAPLFRDAVEIENIFMPKSFWSILKME